MFEILVVTRSQSKQPVVEIYYNNLYWAQIAQEDKECVVQFFPHPDEEWWEFPFDEAIQILRRARERLLHE